MHEVDERSEVLLQNSPAKCGNDKKIFFCLNIQNENEICKLSVMSHNQLFT